LVAVGTLSLSNPPISPSFVSLARSKQHRKEQFTDWLQLSIFHFGFEGLIVNEVRYLSLVDKKYGLNIEVPGSAILSSFGFNVLALWQDVAGLGVVCGVFLVLGYAGLHFLLVERR
jgi:uncharacterized membrane protein YeiB